MTLLRADLLRGATIVLCGDARPAVGRELERLGARCAPFDHGLDRSALENLARTLSVEWARHAITVTAIAPGAATSDEEVAGLVAFLLSPAGDYYSGCRFELGAVEVG